MAYLDEVLKVAKDVPVFPCRATEGKNKKGETLKVKRPHITKFKERATQDEKQIRNWWGKWPDALVGMPTGKRSGIFGLDLDTDGNGKSGLELLPSELEPGSVVQSTRRGAHVLYKYPEDAALGNTTNAVGKGIDTRGEGGYLIISPSTGYKITGLLSDVGRTPVWLLEALQSGVRTDREKDGTEVQDAATVIHALNLLRPEDYQDYQSWTRLMMACYHGSDANEEVKEAFKKWSAQDILTYDNDTDDQIDLQWGKYATENENIVTFKTLKHEVRKHHGAYVQPEVGDVEEMFIPVQESPGVKVAEKTPKLQPTSKGIKINHFNLSIILRYPKVMGKDNPLCGLFKFNELSHNAEFAKEPPWASNGVSYINKSFDDNNAVQLISFLSSRYKADFSKDMILNAVPAYGAAHNAYHPIQDYLSSLKWDGEERIDKWLLKSAHVRTSAYIKAVSKKFLIGAVARAMNPGSKMDTMLVLEGPQGIKKTSLVEALAGDWYRAPTVTNLAGQEAALACLGAWVCEVEEMESVRASSIGAIKKFITTRKDTMRFCYEKTYTDVQRGFVLIGTINPHGNNQYIHDSTGARRFWPIKCKKMIDVTWLTENRDQLFAEALHRYNAGEIWWMDEHEEKEAKVEQQERMSDHIWYEPIDEFLTFGAGSEYKTVATGQLFDEALIGLTGPVMSSRDSRSIANVMGRLGWDHKRSRTESDGTKGDPRKRYIRPSIDDIDIDDF